MIELYLVLVTIAAIAAIAIFLYVDCRVDTWRKRQKKKQQTELKAVKAVEEQYLAYNLIQKLLALFKQHPEYIGNCTNDEIGVLRVNSDPECEGVSIYIGYTYINITDCSDGNSASLNNDHPNFEQCRNELSAIRTSFLERKRNDQIRSMIEKVDKCQYSTSSKQPSKTKSTISIPSLYVPNQ